MIVISRHMMIQRYKTVRTEHKNGSVSFNYRVPNGTTTAVVTIQIDAEAILAALGPKAIRAKGKKASAQHGKIKVTARALINTPPADDAA